MDISEGYTFEFIFYALPLFALAIGLSFVNIYIGPILFIPGIILLLNKTGTIIEKDKIGRYNSILNKRKIEWTSLKEIDSAILNFELISQRMNSRGSSTNYSTKTYELVLTNDKKKVIFHEYHNYENAKKVLKSINEINNIEVTNKFVETQKATLRKRRNK